MRESVEVAYGAWEGLFGADVAGDADNDSFRLGLPAIFLLSSGAMSDLRSASWLGERSKVGLERRIDAGGYPISGDPQATN